MDNHDGGVRYLINVYSIEVSTHDDIKLGSKIDIAIGLDADLNNLSLTTKMCDEYDFLSLAPEGTNQGKHLLSRDVPMWKTLAFGLACFMVGATFWKPPSMKTIKNIKKIANAVCEIAAEIKEMATSLES